MKPSCSRLHYQHRHYQSEMCMLSNIFQCPTSHRYTSCSVLRSTGLSYRFLESVCHLHGVFQRSVVVHVVQWFVLQPVNDGEKAISWDGYRIDSQFGYCILGREDKNMNVKVTLARARKSVSMRKNNYLQASCCFLDSNFLRANIASEPIPAIEIRNNEEICDILLNRLEYSVVNIPLHMERCRCQQVVKPWMIWAKF